MFLPLKTVWVKPRVSELVHLIDRRYSPDRAKSVRNPPQNQGMARPRKIREYVWSTPHTGVIHQQYHCRQDKETHASCLRSNLSVVAYTLLAGSCGNKTSICFACLPGIIQVMGHRICQGMGAIITCVVIWLSAVSNPSTTPQDVHTASDRYPGCLDLQHARCKCPKQAYDTLSYCLRSRAAYIRRR